MTQLQLHLLNECSNFKHLLNNWCRNFIHTLSKDYRNKSLSVLQNDRLISIHSKLPKKITNKT